LAESLFSVDLLRIDQFRERIGQRLLYFGPANAMKSDMFFVGLIPVELHGGSLLSVVPCENRPAGALQVPGDVDDDDALVALEQEEQLEELDALVVEEVFPPVFDDEFGEEDGDFAAGVLVFEFEDVVHEGADD